MNNEQKDTYLAWLNDAHAMEVGLVKTLEKQVESTEREPQMQRRISEHLGETRRHVDLVKECIEHNGGDTSAGKDMLSKMSATLAGWGTTLMGDAMVKQVHQSYAAEQFEIATYTAIKAAAQARGDTQTAKICDIILADEERMAQWLIEQIPYVVTRHLSKVAI